MCNLEKGINSPFFGWGMADLTYDNNNNDTAEGVTGAGTGTMGVHVSHMLYADDLALLANDPHHKIYHVPRSAY
jgi:hypothetical protein